MSDVAIKVENISKSFRLPHEKQGSIKSVFLSGFRRRTFEKQKVLHNISFEVKKGEFFGIVGRNGSGKSTLLKLLAGVYTPDSGAIHVNGKLTPFIELGVGFSPELTGRENVFLNGALLGFNRTEMQAMYGEIVRFAELEKFMDQALKNYSSGMQVRLAFAIAIQAKTGILLLDEVLAVGDSSFQQKCFNHFEQLKREKKTVVLVTHDMGSVKRFCSHALLIEDGKIKNMGAPEEVANQYLLDNITNTEDGKEAGDEKNINKKLKKEVRSLTLKMNSSQKVQSKEPLVFTVEYMLEEDLEVDLGYSIISGGFHVAEQNTKLLELPSAGGVGHKVRCEIPLNNLNAGQFSLDIAIFTRKNTEVIGYEVGVAQFIVEGFDETRGGPMKTEGNWRIVE